MKIKFQNWSQKPWWDWRNRQVGKSPLLLSRHFCPYYLIALPRTWTEPNLWLRRGAARIDGAISRDGWDVSMRHEILRSVTLRVDCFFPHKFLRNNTGVISLILTRSRRSCSLQHLWVLLSQLSFADARLQWLLGVMMIDGVIWVVNYWSFSFLVKLSFLIEMAVVYWEISALVVKTLNVFHVVELRFKSILARAYTSK